MIAGLHQTEMTVNNKLYQVLSLSGLTWTKPLSALHGAVPQLRRSTAVIHLGINNCKLGHSLSNQMWRILFSSSRRCFIKGEVKDIVYSTPSTYLCLPPHCQHHPSPSPLAHRTLTHSLSFYIKSLHEPPSPQFFVSRPVASATPALKLQRCHRLTDYTAHRL